jgi:hypothetical protein
MAENGVLSPTGARDRTHDKRVVSNTDKKARIITAIVNRESSATSRTWDTLVDSVTGSPLVSISDSIALALIQREHRGGRCAGLFGVVAVLQGGQHSNRHRARLGL